MHIFLLYKNGGGLCSVSKPMDSIEKNVQLAFCVFLVAVDISLDVTFNEFTITEYILDVVAFENNVKQMVNINLLECYLRLMVQK